ncbi:MAG: hypothetical protein KGP12_01010 [Actinomycetales bacterium]|nr:hypothetical protein [Actinomycetales bacterium]
MTTDEHRAPASSAYHQCWELLESERTPAQDLDLLTCALSSRYHWQQAGGPAEWAIADWMASRCAAAIGQPSLALAFAQASATHDASGFAPWLAASLLEGQARAWASAGDLVQRDRLIAMARGTLADEPDQQNRELIERQISELT